ncbi:hypothetical protein M569_08065 [Genlisea aurea]|uniref:Uncharacterized protein n=1 Tax=Genlisea aurea TaxID=192259 RepID=S8CPD4_9LAMI|nr:hypothetical protein M569_08065 [Genlisea aurea]
MEFPTNSSSSQQGSSSSGWTAYLEDLSRDDFSRRGGISSSSSHVRVLSFENEEDEKNKEEDESNMQGTLLITNIF